MSSNQEQLQSILKNVVLESQKKPAENPKPSAEEAKEIAIHHARLLQHRKDLESEILDSLVLLSEYPLVRAPSRDSSNPAPSDVSSFKTHVRLFQPSDYDDLIIERNINGLCGYAICPRPRRRVNSRGEWKITNSGDIVKREDIERWCSSSCAKKALFVKVQLNETAAWERAGIPDIQIELLGEAGASDETETDRTARELGNLKLEEQRKSAKVAEALALERGDRGNNANPDKVAVELKEKETKAPKPDYTTEEQSDEDHLLIEGHRIELPHRPKS